MGKRKTLSIETIKRWLRDPDCDVRTAAMNACQGKDVPLEVIREGLCDPDWRVRTAAMNACQGKDVPLEVIREGLRDLDCDVRTAAMNACQGKDVPLEVIREGLRDPDCDVRTAAMNACQGKDVPPEVLREGLRDLDWRVRTAAMNACKERGVEIPIIRTFEPPKLVYKKCAADVIVIASIPADAQVRGRIGCKCRASKAVIKEIIGDFCGEKVGISIYDRKTTYFVGDEVEIENFDMSDEECSTGFHFFCAKEEAEQYR